MKTIFAALTSLAIAAASLGISADIASAMPAPPTCYGNQHPVWVKFTHKWVCVPTPPGCTGTQCK